MIALTALNAPRALMNDIVIDEITTDEVRSAGFDLRHAEERVTSFKTFIEDNKDELTALQIIYNQSYGQQRLGTNRCQSHR